MAGLLGGDDSIYGGPMGLLGAQLMAGNSPFFGVNAGNAMNQAYAVQQSAKKDNRADQVAELAQLASTYKMLQDQDEQARQTALWTKTPYTPNPLLKLHEQKLAQLMGMPTPSTSMQQAQQQVQQPTQQPLPVPASVASNYSSAVRPEYQAQGPMPAPAQQQAAPQSDDIDPSQLARGAGIDPRIAADWARTPAGRNELYKQLSSVYAPRVVDKVMMQLQPNGQTKMLGGVVSQDTVPVVADGQGNLTARPIAGLTDYFANKAGAVEGATQAAKAPYTPITVPNPNGSATTMMLNRFMGGGQPQNPQSPQPAGLSVTQPPRPGSGASFGGAGTSQTPGDAAQQVELSKYHAQNFIDTQQAGKQAQSGLLKLDRMDQLMQGVATGKLTPTGMQIAAYADSLGVPLDKSLPNKQAAEALAGQIALELRNPAGGAGMPGSLSDNDLKFLRSMTPGMAQTTEGRAMIIDTKRKLLQRDQEVAQLARNYYKSNNGKIGPDLVQKIQEYADAHPLFPQASGGSDIDALVNQYRTK